MEIIEQTAGMPVCCFINTSLKGRSALMQRPVSPAGRCFF